MDKYITPKSKQYLAFNIWDTDSAKAVMDAAARTCHDVILQTSMKAFSMMDKEQIRRFITDYARKNHINAYLHLDHCKMLDPIQEAVEYGWDSVMIDVSDKSLDQNIRVVNEICTLLKGKNVLVEAEVGRVGGTEEDNNIVEAGIASVKDIRRFVQNTDVDLLAIAIGTSHGAYFGLPMLYYELAEQTARFTDIPIVVHGGSGLTDSMLRKLLSYPNIKKINFSTDVKLAYRSGIEESMQKGYMEEKGFDPLKITGLIHASIEKMAENKLELLKRE